MSLAAVFLAGCSARSHDVFSEQPRERLLPILMYHSVLKDPAKWGAYVISPEVVEEDLTFLKELGYESVTVSDLVAYVDGRANLPQKPVMITFDDGHYNNLTYAQPILEKLGMRAVLSPVGEYTQRYSELPDPNPNYGYLSWEELREISETGVFEVQNHSYAMHGSRGSMPAPGETDAEYAGRFSGDVAKMQQALAKNSGITAVAFTYPLGLVDPHADQYLREMGFRASFSAYERMNRISQGDADCLFSLGRYNRPSGVSTAAFMEKLLDG